MEQVPLRDTSRVAELLKSGKVKNVIVMAGAGISTSAGIPDFRSPDTGIYANLQRFNLPTPEDMFDLEFFLEFPEPFFQLAKELHPGKYKPTPTHFFFRLLQDKGVLKTVFTQNIDTLERRAGIEDSKLVEAHGSFAEAKCTVCQNRVDYSVIQEDIENGTVAYCDRKVCRNKDSLVKPTIVFFGEQLPESFFDHIEDFKECDLLIVLGTSLQVRPFANLIDLPSRHVPRLLINLDTVGQRRIPFIEQGFNFAADQDRDSRYIGPSDEGVMHLVTKCGWWDDFYSLVKTHPLGADALKALDEFNIEESLSTLSVKDAAKAPSDEKPKSADSAKTEKNEPAKGSTPVSSEKAPPRPTKQDKL